MQFPQSFALTNTIPNSMGASIAGGVKLKRRVISAFWNQNGAQICPGLIHIHNIHHNPYFKKNTTFLDP
jgi:hypothetical protein